MLLYVVYLRLASLCQGVEKDRLGGLDTVFVVTRQNLFFYSRGL
jgi:hypothetical protein